MDFSYIQPSSKCPPDCAKTGRVGSVDPGPDGRPNDPGPNLSSPVTPALVERQDGLPIPPGKPTTGVGKEIACSSIWITQKVRNMLAGQQVAFNFSVLFSDGTTNWSAGNGLTGASVVWSSSDDEVATFPEATRVSRAVNGGDGYVLQALRTGTVTIGVLYQHSGTKDIPGRAASENWYAPCQLETTLEVNVVSVTTATTPDLAPLQDFIKDPFTSDQLLRIEIPPTDSITEDAFMEIGDKWTFRAAAIMGNGSSSNVSSDALWSSSDTDVATVDQFGVATGVGVGIATITATYKGFSASAVCEVANLASAATEHGNTWTVRPIDTVLVLDRSASMQIRDPHGLSRIERARDAALQFLAVSDRVNDQIAIVTFAGTWIAGASEAVAAQTEADATLDLPLTDDWSDLRQIINEYRVRGPCGMVEWSGTRCATGIGAALQVAQNEINSDRHEYGHKKMILLMTDGCENVNKPAPLSVALDIQEEGTLLCVIALDTASCSTDLQALATPGLYFPSPTAYELAKTFAEVPHTVGYGEHGYAWYE